MKKHVISHKETNSFVVKLHLKSNGFLTIEETKNPDDAKHFSRMKDIDKYKTKFQHVLTRMIDINEEFILNLKKDSGFIEKYHYHELGVIQKSKESLIRLSELVSQEIEISRKHNFKFNNKITRKITLQNITSYTLCCNNCGIILNKIAHIKVNGIFICLFCLDKLHKQLLEKNTVSPEMQSEIERELLIRSLTPKGRIG